MKVSLILTSALPLAIALSLSSCATGPYADNSNAKEGAAWGGILGAGLGAIVGNQSGRPLEGALIGGAAGAGTGALFGSSQDERNATARRRQASYYGNTPPQGGYYGNNGQYVPREVYRPRENNYGGYREPYAGYYY